MCNIVTLSANNLTSTDIIRHYNQDGPLIMTIEAAEESSFLPNVISTITMIAMPLIMGTGFDLYRWVGIILQQFFENSQFYRTNSDEKKSRLVA